jgi:SAM-dependent methyltransferase
VTGDATPLRLVPLGRCVLCGSPATRERFVQKDLWFGLDGRFCYRTCDACGTVFQDPQVATEDIPRLYPQTYFTHGPGEGAPAPEPPPPPARQGAHLRDRLRASLRRAAQGGGGGGRVLAWSRALRQRTFFGLTDELIPRPEDRRALEIGCGSGDLLALLSRAGWPEVEGVEFDPIAAERARMRSGRPVLVTPFPEQVLPAGVFDLVVLVHVFEHLPEPRAGLTRLRQLVSPRGRIVIIGPNPEGLGARVFRECWVGWEPPRHLSLPTIGALAAAASGVGLRLVRARTRTRFAEDFSRSRAWQAGRAFGPAGVRDQLWRAASATLAAAGARAGEEMVVVLARTDGG